MKFKDGKVAKMENKKTPHNPIKLVRLKWLKMENWFGKILFKDI